MEWMNGCVRNASAVRLIRNAIPTCYEEENGRNGHDPSLGNHDELLVEHSNAKYALLSLLCGVPTNGSIAVLPVRRINVQKESIASKKGILREGFAACPTGRLSHLMGFSGVSYILPFCSSLFSFTCKHIFP